MITISTESVIITGPLKTNYDIGRLSYRAQFAREHKDKILDAIKRLGITDLQCHTAKKEIEVILNFDGLSSIAEKSRVIEKFETNLKKLLTELTEQLTLRRPPELTLISGGRRKSRYVNRST